MKKDVVKELQSTLNKRKANNDKNPVISEVNRLLEYDSLRDSEILKSIGSSSTLIQSENERGAIIELEKQENFYSGTIFTYDQILKVGTKYRLKFLPSSLFKSYITPLVASDVKELERFISESMTKDQANKRNMSVEEYVKENGAVKYSFDANELKNKFYILAPAKCFVTEKVAAFTIKSPDPILFYSINGEHFRLIRKWGADFTIFRRLKGVALFSRRSLYWSIFFSVLSISLGLSIAFNWNFMLLMLLCGAAVPIVYATEWDYDFFGQRFVTSKKSY